MSDYEALREANIKANRELLVSLGLDTPLIPAKPKPKPTNAPTKNKKRKADATSGSAGQPPLKANKVAAVVDPDTTLARRSARNAAKPRISYNGSQENASASSFVKSRTPQLISSVSLVDSGREHVGNRLGKRIHDPKKYGAIPGVEVGTWWETRAGCSTDAVHAPFVAGIAGSANQGAYSVALSGGYDDDVDLGYAFTYTGSGGRDLKGTKTNPKNLRTAPQSSDQNFENPMNAALKRSAETKKPVRVIRGYKLNSPYATVSGYRYDGLYTVEKAWLERGLNKQGYKVCKYAFKRIEGQLPLPDPDAHGVNDLGRPLEMRAEEVEKKTDREEDVGMEEATADEDEATADEDDADEA